MTTASSSSSNSPEPSGPSGVSSDLAGLFTAIDHVGVAVNDLDEAIAYHRDVLGMPLVHEESNPDQGVREAMMGIGDSGSYVQLLAPLSDESPIAKFLGRCGPGLQQVAYRVDDIDAVTAILRDRGVRVLYDQAKPGTAGARINFIHPKDAGGVLVEIVEPADTGSATASPSTAATH